MRARHRDARAATELRFVGRHSSQIFLNDLLVIYVLIRQIFIVTQMQLLAHYYTGRLVLYLETL